MSLNIAPRLNYAAYEADPALFGPVPDQIVLTVETNLPALRQVWRDFERSAAGYVYQSFDWVSIWNNSVGRRDGVTPHIVLGRAADGRLLFLLPLGLRRRSGADILVWLGGREADLKAGLFAPELLGSLSEGEWNALWRRIRDVLPPVDMVYLLDQPELLVGFRNPFAPRRTHVLPDGTHATRLTRDWKTYYQAKRSGAARNLEKRRMRQLQAEGEQGFKLAQSPEEVLELLEWLFEHKAKSLASIGVRDPFADDSVRAFYVESAKDAFPQGVSHLSALTLNGKPVSVVWGLVHNRRYYYLVSAYDDAFSRCSPGRLHLRELLRWSVENRLDIFDLGVGEQDYKFHWCEEHVGLFATVEGETPRGHALAALVGSKIWLKRRIKRSKLLWPLAQAARARIGRLGLPQ